MKPTAMEWLVEQLPIRIINSYQSEIAKALEMEKQQIIDAYCAAEDNSEFLEYEHRYNREYLTAEPYYNETYNKNKK